MDLSWLKDVVPGIATALGGPLAGVAASFIADKLGVSEKTVEAVTEAIQGNKLSPEQVSSLKLAEIEFQKFLKQNEIDLEAIHAGDRDSARRRETAVRDWVPGTLAVGITVGFFGILGWLMVNGVPPSGGDALLVMLGALGSGFTGVLAYYFGSSAGSAAKSSDIARLMAKQ
jgi:hypothetical protein